MEQTQNPNYISLASAKRRFGIGLNALKSHLPIVEIGYRTKLVRVEDVEALLDRLTVQPTDRPAAAAPAPRPRRGGGKRRDLLG